MTADTNIMREAASRVSEQKNKYDSAVEDLNQLIVKLGQYWGDEAYDSMKQKYDAKSSKDLAELSQVLGDFSRQITEAADELDRRIDSLV